MREATGWELKVSPELSNTEAPTAEELANLRALKEASK